MATRLHLRRPLRILLLFIILHTNIVLVLKSESACAIRNPSTILVYMIINGKEDLAGYGLHGYSHISFRKKKKKKKKIYIYIYLTSQSNTAV